MSGIMTRDRARSMQRLQHAGQVVTMNPQKEPPLLSSSCCIFVDSFVRPDGMLLFETNAQTH
ncbi:MAG: hypothetical protein A3H96_20470 [Acidobacteria bacterium RIFCSPLOWO2_02_FULL_67_36]|nr:MAG: hypothetical protein A3H96_20470 [Acidobacteria bacterium RIFCSPLOWO2_02_FULL_67_36]OFW18623.1 MAG: hypothetical protein A3G21_12865 [Acidobacteria bacterium RIFCSPLOWO2_12_FULL_66_21]